MTCAYRLALASILFAIFAGNANADILLTFDSLANGSIVIDQFRANGVVFDKLTTIAQGTGGVDGAATAPNTVQPSNISTSIFDGKSAATITAQYGITQQQGFGETFADVLFVLDGTNLPAVTDSVSLLAGFDFNALGANEVNRMVLEAFDSNFNLIAFARSPRLDSAVPTELSITSPGIRGVRITQSDGVTFDNFRFNITAVPEPSSAVLLMMGLFSFVYRGWRSVA